MPDPIVQGIVDKLYPPSEDTGPAGAAGPPSTWKH
jgi:hypothetical protein